MRRTYALDPNGIPMNYRKPLILVFSIIVFCLMRLTAQDSNPGGNDRAKYEALANQGDARAMTTLGLMYHQGKDVEQDYKRAFDWYMKAVEGGDGDAFNNIGVMYRDGLGVVKNQRIAYLIFLAIHMEGMGDDDTQVRAGRNLSNLAAQMPEKDVQEAISYTWPYVIQVIKSRGVELQVGAEVLPSEKLPRIRDNGWWMESERAKMTFSSPPPWDKAPKFSADSAEADESFRIVYELRAPKSKTFDPLTKFDFITDRGASGTRLKFTKQHINGNYSIYAASVLIFTGENRRALIVSFENSAPSQVFEIVLPKETKAADWTTWTRPNYLDSQDAAWSFMNSKNQKPPAKSIPSDSFELRYRVEKS